jgi:C-terminal processing protease CtpA/Prc
MSLFKSLGSHLYNSLLLSVIILFTLACKDEAPEPAVPEQTQQVNEFIWEYMDALYLWRDKMPRNIDRNMEVDPEAYFEKIVYRAEDPWSFIMRDKNELSDLLRGISKSFGYQYKLFRADNSDQVFGVVEFVLPGGPADRQGVKRGDVFVAVNNVPINTTNYRQLLYEQSAYSLTLGSYSGGLAVAGSDKINIVAETFQENPILLDSVYSYGNNNIGYVVYNRFLTDFEDRLEDTFTKFKSSGVNELVLDLRYNPGGSVYSAMKLASMIAPAQVPASQSLFLQYIWNAQVQKEIIDSEGEFSDNLKMYFEPTAVNLNLDRVYVLTSDNSASASELVINSLRPYMEVVLIGSANTSGKYAGSNTFTDPDERHDWAIQPIIFKVANASGVTDYRNGFAPDHLVPDDYFADLGSLEENTLGKAYELITGQVIASPARVAATVQGEAIASANVLPVEQLQMMY